MAGDINSTLTRADVAHHNRTWRRFVSQLRPFIEKEFHYTHEDVLLEPPFLVISNHVTRWDPLLLALSFPRNQLYFVASEHLFRMGSTSKLLHYFAAPIAKKKGSNVAADTVMTAMRRFKVGGNVAIFAEGETTWDGTTDPIFTATGKLAKISGATLVTYRLEGGYFTLPRWGSKVRRGRMHGHPVNIYPPEVLKKMSADEVNAAINRDISEDAWQRQDHDHVEYHRRRERLAEHLETALFLCPKCHRIGHLKSHYDTLSCDCGFKVIYTGEGFFQPAEPFKTVQEWDQWQMEKLKEGDYEKQPRTNELFGDDNMVLSREVENHLQLPLTTGRLSQFPEILGCGGRVFQLEGIKNMAIVKNDLLLFTYEDQYYEVKSRSPACLRKYLAYWQDYKKKND